MTAQELREIRAVNEDAGGLSVWRAAEVLDHLTEVRAALEDFEATHAADWSASFEREGQRCPCRPCVTARRLLGVEGA